MPLNVDLLENNELLEACIDNTAGFPPAGGAAEVLEEAELSFSPHGTKEQPSEKTDPVVVEDASLKLKQLEAELNPMLASQSNININVNKQEEVVKLTEKCLNNAIESPMSTSVRLPPDIKSNILKAQAEAGHKVTREDSMSGNKNTNIQDAAARTILLSGKVQNSPLRAHSPVFQELNAIPISNAFILNELNEDNAASSLEDRLSPANLPPAEAAVLKNTQEDVEILLTSQAENLIDFTEAMPRVSSPSTVVPRWLVPSGLVSNGPLGNDVGLALKAVKGSTEALSVMAGSPPLLYSPETMPSSVAEDATTRPKCLLTTEL
ncbi:band 4.1-like protein 5 [Elgaria multicarinata webbii]|uniref:band 4.1-like protein 5 n=1 Tax=Elgaria multicarinata webbii TaxID=159646 RepID=UPI002FCCE9C9